MLKYKIFMMLFATRVALCDCHSEKNQLFRQETKQYAIHQIGKMPENINESSGLIDNNDGTLLTHNDGGGNAEIYKINTSGKLLETVPIAHAQNIDWEDITKDTNGNLYIGDFGNNAHNRKDLGIYKVTENATKKINFRYADQSTFPAQYKNFDCEAFFWFKNHLYLFSKNWEKKYKTCKLYKLKDEEGNYTITPKDSITLKTAVTAAAISPDNKHFALLTYGKILIFDIINDEINFKYPKICIKTGRNQTEGITFINNNELIFCNEQRKMYIVNYHN